MHIVVIGAGVIGSSIALQLTRNGHEVTVIDRNPAAGLGSTSSSSAVVRFNYSSFDAVMLAWESYFLWKEWQSLIDGTDGFSNKPEVNSQTHYAYLKDCGCAMLDVPVLSNEKTIKLFDKANIPYEIWDSSTLKVRMPGIDAGKYWPNKPVKSEEFWNEARQELGGIYTPAGGYINDPLLAAQNLATSASREGATFRYRKAVTKIAKDSKNGRVTGVQITDFDSQQKSLLASGDEFIAADVIVNVTGPWSTLINSMAGALPIFPTDE